MRCLAGLILSLSGVVGCGDDCAQRLSDFQCVSENNCPTYDELVNDERGIWQAVPCERAELIIWSRNIDGGGTVLYFNESREIVAAESFGYQHDSCGGQVLYGPVPSCPEEQWWRNSY